jgi:cytoplasmic iron level regulating protein YaaA (DUF328/UPF0246 family)
VRDAVRRAIAAEGETGAAALLGARGAHLARALAEWEALDAAPTLPAAERYTGVVWGALGVASLDRAARRRLDARVLVPSGLWGLLAATDAVPAYRLRMGARVAPLGRLTTMWRPRLTPLIDARAAGGWVIDLLPDEHAAAFDGDLLVRSRHLRVEMVDEGPEGRRSVGHAGKSLKGLLARAILEAGATTPRAVAGLKVPGLTLGSSHIPRRGPAALTFVRTRS